MFLLRLLILIFLALNIFANDDYINSLTLAKVKKLIEKEEEIATAYKKYILEKGSETTDITTLKKLSAYLPSNFSTNNYFGGNISFSTNTHKLISFPITDNNLKSNIYDYYYSNKYRTNTKAPLSTNNSDVEIVLSAKEKFIYKNKNKITTTKADAMSAPAGKYYLDPNGVLHWYQSGSYKFSVDKDLIVDSSVTMINANKTVNTAFKDMIKDVTYAGQTIIQNNSNTNSAEAYIGINENTIVRQNPDVVLNTQLGVIQIGKNSGGMIVNGDIYTWGNNINRITGVNIDSYTKDSGTTGNKIPIVNTLVKVRAKIYDNNLTDTKDLTTFYTQNYFSSPLRPRFVDIFSNTKNGTCGISTIGELYCGGIVSASDKSFGNLFTQVDTDRNGEMLYRSTYFDGTTDSKKASKIFANNQLWLILSKDGDIYRWGYESTNKNGFSGNGTSDFNNSLSCSNVCTNYSWQIINWSWQQVCTNYVQQCTSTVNTDKVPEKITENLTSIKFKDISNTLTIGYKKMIALSTDKRLYIWGKDTNIADMTTTNCNVTWEGVSFNLCQATQITSSNSTLPNNLTFESIRSGLRAIIALGSDGKYYKIDQPKTYKIQVTEIKDGTTSLPSGVLSVDLTSNGTVVYVNASNRLISGYFSTFDDTFKNTINSMLWKSIKVLEDTNNSMCGINTDNQMYCWGVQTYSSTKNSEDNTFILPVFNTNLFDVNKDYLFVEGGTNISPSIMTSGTWLNNSNFDIKYPTYIGGFNYEFIFK